MRVARLLLCSVLVFGFGRCLPRPASAQTTIQEKVEDARRQGDRILERVYLDMAEEDEFIADFLRPPPQEQVRMWLAGGPKGPRHGLAATRMEELIVRRLTATAPYLAEILRSEGCCRELRLGVLEVLCKMDRFVPADQLIIPDQGYASLEESVPTKGLFDDSMVVDGRRIGKEAYEAVMQAAEQTRDKGLRFRARLLSGLLERDLRRLPLDEQVRRWRAAVAKDKGAIGETEAGEISFYLGGILAQEAPDSLPLLAEILDKDPNGYVREEAISVIWDVDYARVRLRGTEAGRRAVEAVRRALERGGLKPSFGSRKERERVWREISAQVFDDELSAHFNIALGVYIQGLEHLYGADVICRRGERRQDFCPEVRQFVTYLSKVDPYFPSWEYADRPPATSELLEPRFKAKVARYHEQWKNFEAERDRGNEPAKSPGRNSN
jgi:hypothetical protein